MEGKSKYISLCKKLDQNELKEEVEARQLAEQVPKEEVTVKDSQPVPDLKQLQQDVQNQSLRVAFSL